MTDLFAQHLDMARAIARGVAAKVPQNVAREDLEQAALIGLHQWCTAHPDSSHPGWRGGLITRVRGAVLDWLRAEDYLPRRSRARGDDLHVIRLDDLSSEDGPGWQDTLGEFADPSEYAREDVLRALAAEMPERDRLLIIEVFGRGTMQASLAQELGVSQPRIAQLVRRALQTMREHLERQREIAAAPSASVQVLATPKWRRRDFYAELRRVARATLFQKMRDAPAASKLAAVLGAPETTVWKWTGPEPSLPRFLRGQSGVIGAELRERARTLMAGAHREAAGSPDRIGELLTISPMTARRLIRILLPKLATDRRTNKAVSTTEIQRLAQAGLSTHQIAMQLDCSRCLVRGRLGQRRRRCKDDP